MPKSGNFDNRAKDAIPASGQYWNAGRVLAAAASLADTVGEPLGAA
jgi:hypothetical protein